VLPNPEAIVTPVLGGNFGLGAGAGAIDADADPDMNVETDMDTDTLVGVVEDVLVDVLKDLLASRLRVRLDDLLKVGLEDLIGSVLGWTLPVTLVCWLDDGFGVTHVDVLGGKLGVEYVCEIISEL